MSRKLGFAIAAIAVLAGLAIWWKSRGSEPVADPVASSAGSGSGSAVRGPRGEGARNGDVDFGRVRIDDDPKGTLRLEGQVIDADDHPVKGATVVLGANPPRTTTTEDDGSFVFDQLVARPYSLSARATTGIAGPITSRLTGKSDPVVLKLRPGAKLTVTVTAGGKPIDATVELRGEDEQRIEAKGGTAVFAQVVPGGYTIAAWAPGMARAFQWIAISGTTEARISLSPGAPVSGRVVDDKGVGVVGASVRYGGASDWSQQASDRLDAAITIEDGKFELPALPAGSFRFTATHEEHAPGTSALVTLDGKNPTTGVAIQLTAGATVRGKVVDAAGQAVASARVRFGVATNPRMMIFEAPRQVYTTADGTFAVKGLPRKLLQAVALHETGASQSVEVDTSGGDVANVRLTIDVTGTIAGVVVDPAGQPVEGAQVSAGPSFADNRTRVDFSQWRLRGFPQELTDASGKFTLTGLSPGSYTISAASTARRSRRGPGVGDGVVAATGDNNVKLILAPEGSVKGKVAFADGSTPGEISVAVGMVGQPFPGGEFLIDGLPPQQYDVNVRGPSFQTRVVSVVVESGKTADLGTITVTKGRAIGGVVTADGKPVPGATVHVGRMVFGNGTSSNARFGPMGQNTKHDTTDASGAFVLSGFPEGDITIVAEHETIGRSRALRLPTVMPGQTELVLALEKFGTLTGVLRQAGKPVEGVFVSCQSTTTPGAIYSVASGPDGGYRFDRLAPDTYKVSATVGNPMVGMRFYSKQVIVPSGGQVAVDLAVEPGTVTIDATITARNGKLGVAQVTLTTGAIVATTYNELGLKLAAAGNGASQLVIVRNGEPARLGDVMPGGYTLCVVPYPAEIKGLAAMGYIERHGDTLDAFCKPVTVAPSPDTQQVQISVELPPVVAEPGAGSGSGSGR
jgi:hypothetical protein